MNYKSNLIQQFSERGYIHQATDISALDALAADHDPDFSNDDEQLVYEFSRELNLTRGVSDALYTRAIAILGEEGTVDLVGVLGYYALISMTIKAFDVDPTTAS